jgi:hypothetical protein
MRRGTMVWSIAVAMLAILAAGAWRYDLFAQPIWSGQGLARLAVFSLLYWIALIAAGRRFPPLLAAVAVLWAAVSVGPVAVAAAGLVLCAAYGIGTLVANGAVAVAAGLAVYTIAIGWIAALPVNTPWIYGALLAPGLWRAAPRLREALRTASFPSRPGWLALSLYLAAIHLLAALFSEAGSDALAIHLAVPASVANHGQWTFDPSHFSWALMPMGGDWAYTLAYLFGGEASARLLNFAMTAFTAVVIHRLARRFASADAAHLAAALYLSTPAVYFISSSLLVETFWTLLLCAALDEIAAFREHREARSLLAVGLLAGAALSAKLLAVAFLAPMAVALAAIAGRRIGTPALLALVLGGKPYLDAWIRTGNPVFPFFNSVFQSPLFSTSIPNADPRYPAAGWDFLWTAAFQSSQVMEGHGGSLGFHYLVLVPAAFVLIGRTPWAARAALLAAIVGAAAILSQMAYLRYIVPAMALACAACAWSIAEAARHAARVRFALAAVVLLNTYFLAAPAWHARDFALPPGDRAREQHLRDAAPVRALVDFWNREARGEPVAFFEEDAIAGLIGPAYTASWRTWSFRHALDLAESPVEAADLLRAKRVRAVVAPAPDAGFASQHAVAQGVLWVCGEVAARSGPYAAWRIGDSCLDLTPEQWYERYFEDAPVAEAGDYDDTSSAVRYGGPWLHDRQFASAAGHTVSYTSDPGSFAQIRFRGRRVRLVYTAAFNRGVGEVVLDGVSVARLDQRSDETRWQTEAAFEASGDGLHTLRVILTAERPGAFLDVDRFLVE